jgi:cell division protein ZapA
MAQDPSSVEITVLGHTYTVACPPGQQGRLIEAAALLDERMRSVQGTGKVIGAEKIAMMAALHLAYDYLFSPSSKSFDVQEAKRRIKEMEQRLDRCFFEQDTLF